MGNQPWAVARHGYGRRLRAAAFSVVASVSMASLGAAHADAETQALISACADGNMAICQQIGQLQPQPEPALLETPLDRLALAFQSRAPKLGIQTGNIPDLEKAYRFVVEDYFAAPAMTPEKRQRYFKQDLLASCAQHYSETWQGERDWWPTDNAGGPDWKLLYSHILDHYFGYCVH